MEVRTVRIGNLQIRGSTSTIEKFWSTTPSIEWCYQKKVFVLPFRRETLSSVNVGFYRETLTASHLVFPISNSYLLFWIGWKVNFLSNISLTSFLVFYVQFFENFIPFALLYFGKSINAVDFYLNCLANSYWFKLE